MVTPVPSSRPGGAGQPPSATKGMLLKLRNGSELRLHDISRMLQPAKINADHKPSTALLIDLAEPDDFKYMVAWGKENLEEIRTKLESCQSSCRTHQNEISRALNNVNHALAEIARAGKPAGGSALPPPLPPSSAGSLPAAAAVPVLPPPPTITPRPSLDADPLAPEMGRPAGSRTMVERQQVAAEAARGGPRLDEGPEFLDPSSFDLKLDSVFDDPPVTTAANAFTDVARVESDLDLFRDGQIEMASLDDVEVMQGNLTTMRRQLRAEKELYDRAGKMLAVLSLMSEDDFS